MECKFDLGVLESLRKLPCKEGCGQISFTN